MINYFIEISDICRFLRYFTQKFDNYWIGSVAQSVEQRTENPCVGGSIPPGATLNPNGNAGVFCLWRNSVFYVKKASK